jgi:anti-sigma B factor antagonist
MKFIYICSIENYQLIMNFTITQEDKYTILKITAEKLDALISPAIKSELVLINSNGERNIILDLTDTKYCDSSGLSTILVANRLCKNVQSQLNTILNITPTVNEAVDFVYMEEVQKDLENEA